MTNIEQKLQEIEARRNSLWTETKIQASLADIPALVQVVRLCIEFASHDRNGKMLLAGIAKILSGATADSATQAPAKQ